MAQDTYDPYLLNRRIDTLIEALRELRKDIEELKKKEAANESID